MRVKMGKTDLYKIKKVKQKTDKEEVIWDNSDNSCHIVQLSVFETLIYTKSIKNFKNPSKTSKTTIETTEKVTAIAINETGMKIETSKEIFFFKPIKHKEEVKEKAKKSDILH